jgi:hypothetical protein
VIESPLPAKAGGPSPEKNLRVADFQLRLTDGVSQPGAAMVLNQSVNGEFTDISKSNAGGKFATVDD